MIYSISYRLTAFSSVVSLYVRTLFVENYYKVYIAEVRFNDIDIDLEPFAFKAKESCDGRMATKFLTIINWQLVDSYCCGHYNKPNYCSGIEKLKALVKSSKKALH